MSDSLILGILSLLVSLAGTIISALMAYLVAKLNQGQREAAEKVAEVSTTLTLTQAEQTAKLDHVTAKVEEVRNTANGLTTKLVEKTEQEALARGGAEEREREAERKRTEGGAP